MATEVSVGFVLLGNDFDPVEVTKILNIEPSKTWHKGDQISRSLLRRKHDGWSLTIGYEKALDLNKQVKLILDIVRPKAHQIKQICKRFKLSAKIDCAVYIDCLSGEK